MAGQEVDAYTRSQSDAKYELKSTAYTKNESDAKYLRKVDKIDAYSKIECNATFLKKTEKIDSYSKTESDTRYALKANIPDGLPTGAYVLYSSNSNIPSGFLRCDGSALDKITYAALFAVIGYTYGKFMRSIGGNAAALGTAQGDAIRNITGKFQTSAEEFFSETNPNTKNHRGWGAFQRYDAQGSRPTVTTVGKNLAYDFDASRVVPTANENRPLNMAVVVLIKY